MKKKYQSPEVEIIWLDNVDIITTSGGGPSLDDNETPII